MSFKEKLAEAQRLEAEKKAKAALRAAAQPRKKAPVLLRPDEIIDAERTAKLSSSAIERTETALVDEQAAPAPKPLAAAPAPLASGENAISPTPRSDTQGEAENNSAPIPLQLSSENALERDRSVIGAEPITLQSQSNHAPVQDASRSKAEPERDQSASNHALKRDTSRSKHAPERNQSRSGSVTKSAPQTAPMRDGENDSLPHWMSDEGVPILMSLGRAQARLLNFIFVVIRDQIGSGSRSEKLRSRPVFLAELKNAVNNTDSGIRKGLEYLDDKKLVSVPVSKNGPGGFRIFELDQSVFNRLEADHRASKEAIEAHLNSAPNPLQNSSNSAPKSAPNYAPMVSRIEQSSSLKDKELSIPIQNEGSKSKSQEEQEFYDRYEFVSFAELEDLKIFKGPILASMLKNKWFLDPEKLEDLIVRYPGEVKRRAEIGKPIEKHPASFCDYVKLYWKGRECPLAHIKTDEDLEREETLKLSAETSRANAERMRAQIDALKEEKNLGYELWKEMTSVEEKHAICAPTKATEDNPKVYDMALREAWEQKVWPTQRMGR